MGSSGTWVISRTGRGFLVEDRRGRGVRLGELGVSGGRKEYSGSLGTSKGD